MDKSQAQKSNQEKLKLHFLVLRAQVGDENAFRQLYHLFADRTLRFLMSFVAQAAAEDLNQELWLMVYRRISTLSNADGFRTWLFQAARNRALDQLRSYKRMDVLHEVLSTRQETDQEEYIELFELSQEHSGLQNALKQLSASHRETIVLNFLEGMDYEEISLIAGCSLGTVKSRVHHAKLKLKNIMSLKSES